MNILHNIGGNDGGVGERFGEEACEGGFARLIRQHWPIENRLQMLLLCFSLILKGIAALCCFPILLASDPEKKIKKLDKIDNFLFRHFPKISVNLGDEDLFNLGKQRDPREHQILALSLIR